MNSSDFDRVKEKIIGRCIGLVASEFFSPEISDISVDGKRISTIHKIYDDFERIFISKMADKKLDRHKMAACLCLAIMEARPFVFLRQEEKYKGYFYLANESLALLSAINLVHFYTVYDGVIGKNPRYQFVGEFEFPEVISDKNSFFINLVISLYKNKQNIARNPELLSHIFAYLESHNLLLASKDAQTTQMLRAQEGL